MRGGLGAGTEPPAARGTRHRSGAPGGARVSGRRRLLDGWRPCLAVFLAARIGVSLLSVVAVDLIEPLDPVDVPGRAAPAATTGWHNAIDASERQDAVWYLRLAADGWSTEDASAAFFPLYPLTVRAVVVGPPGGRSPRRAPRFEPRVPRSAAGAVRAHRRGVRGPRREAGHRGGGDLPDVLLLPGSLHGVALPAAFAARVPGVTPRSMGAASRSSAPSRRSPAASASSSSRRSSSKRSGTDRTRAGGSRPRRRTSRAQRAIRRRGRDRPRPALLVRLVGPGARQLAGAAGRTAALGSGAPTALGLGSGVRWSSRGRSSPTGSSIC